MKFKKKKVLPKKTSISTTVWGKMNEVLTDSISHIKLKMKITFWQFTVDDQLFLLLLVIPDCNLR